jgi:hypothetical protein
VSSAAHPPSGSLLAPQGCATAGAHSMRQGHVIVQLLSELTPQGALKATDCGGDPVTDPLPGALQRCADHATPTLSQHCTCDDYALCALLATARALVRAPPGGL